MVALHIWPRTKSSFCLIGNEILFVTGGISHAPCNTAVFHCHVECGSPGFQFGSPCWSWIKHWTLSPEQKSHRALSSKASSHITHALCAVYVPGTGDTRDEWCRHSLELCDADWAWGLLFLQVFMEHPLDAFYWAPMRSTQVNPGPLLPSISRILHEYFRKNTSWNICQHRESTRLATKSESLPVPGALSESFLLI